MKTIVYEDPRQLEGTCYDVAGAAADQTKAVFDLALAATDDLFAMSRLAEMERECEDDGDPDGAAFPNKPLGKKIIAVQKLLAQLNDQLNAIKTAATYDPKHPPKEEK